MKTIDKPPVDTTHLRDTFAKVALQGMLAHSTGYKSTKEAYAIADAMLKWVHHD